jgi:HAD superfamily hydrolase (TIGR01490 family)
MNLAIFDLDNTLLSGDSDYAWGEFLVEQGIVDKNYHSRTNAAHLADYNAGKLDIDKFLSFQLEPLKNNPRRILEEIRGQFLEVIIKPMINERARALVRRHREQGHTLMIITATNRFITAPIADEFGIGILIATEVEEIDGQFTGRTFDTPSFGEGKVRRLNKWLVERSVALTSSWFYSDSHNDLPLLEVVDHPVAINPDDALREEARLRKWKTVDW